MSVEASRLGGQQESAVAYVGKQFVYVVVPGLAGTSNGVGVAHDGGESSPRQPLLVRDLFYCAISLTVEISDAAL